MRLWVSYKYKEWRRKIFERDNWICVLCKAKNGSGKFIRLEVDHYPKPFASFISEIKKIQPKKALWYEAAMVYDPLWEAEGRTLCIGCHNKTKRGRETLKAWEEEYRQSGN